MSEGEVDATAQADVRCQDGRVQRSARSLRSKVSKLRFTTMDGCGSRCSTTSVGVTFIFQPAPRDAGKDSNVGAERMQLVVQGE
jgi:hypothetical protein